MAGIVYPKTTGWVSEAVFITEGEPWDADDPFVKAHPEHFADDPGRSLRGSGRSGSEIEQATAAPGEKRTTTSRSTKKATDDS